MFWDPKHLQMSLIDKRGPLINFHINQVPINRNSENKFKGAHYRLGFKR